jgi:hypothetical protein
MGMQQVGSAAPPDAELQRSVAPLEAAGESGGGEFEMQHASMLGFRGAVRRVDEERPHEERIALMRVDLDR